MTLPVKWVTREEMLRSYVARFRDLKGSDKGLPDSDVPSHYKKIFNVFGFDPPSGEAAVNPVGDDATALIHPNAGFSLGFLKTTPGNGPVLHNHNSNETFIPLGGTWRFTWESSPAHTEFVDLGPYDTISFPPACRGASRIWYLLPAIRRVSCSRSLKATHRCLRRCLAC